MEDEILEVSVNTDAISDLFQVNFPCFGGADQKCNGLL